MATAEAARAARQATTASTAGAAASAGGATTTTSQPPASPATPPPASSSPLHDSSAASSAVTPSSEPAVAFSTSAAPPAVAGNWALTLTQSVSLPALLSEKAELEREVRRWREECVAVPRAEYSELSSLRAQAVSVAGRAEGRAERGRGARSG